VETELDPVEERVKSQLPDIVRIVQRELFQFYQKSRISPGETSNEATPTNSTQPELISRNDHELHEHYAFQLAAADDRLAPFWEEPLLDFPTSAFDESNFITPSFSSIVKDPADSGYGTVQDPTPAECYETTTNDCNNNTSAITELNKLPVSSDWFI